MEFALFCERADVRKEWRATRRAGHNCNCQPGRLQSSPFVNQKFIIGALSHRTSPRFKAEPSRCFLIVSFIIVGFTLALLMALKETPPKSAIIYILNTIHLSIKNWDFTSLAPLTDTQPQRNKAQTLDFYLLCSFIWLSKWASRAWNGSRRLISISNAKNEIINLFFGS